MRIHSWDEISGEVDKTDIPDLEQDPRAILRAWYEFIDYEPYENETVQVVEMNLLTLIVINDGQGRMALCWWGEEAESFSHVIGRANGESGGD